MRIAYRLVYGAALSFLPTYALACDGSGGGGGSCAGCSGGGAPPPIIVGCVDVVVETEETMFLGERITSEKADDQMEPIDDGASFRLTAGGQGGQHITVRGAVLLPPEEEAVVDVILTTTDGALIKEQQAAVTGCLEEQWASFSVPLRLDADELGDRILTAVVGDDEHSIAITIE